MSAATYWSVRDSMWAAFRVDLEPAEVLITSPLAERFGFSISKPAGSGSTTTMLPLAALVGGDRQHHHEAVVLADRGDVGRLAVAV